MPEESKGAQVEETEEGVFIALQWDSFDHLETNYVNHVMITHAGPEFYLIFGEMTPLFLKQRGISKDEIPDHVKVIPKVKLAISPYAMLSIAEAIQNNISRFRDTLEEREQMAEEEESEE